MKQKSEFKKPLLDLAMSHIQAQYLLDGDIVQFQKSCMKALLALEELWRGQESWFDTYKSGNKEYEWEGFVGNIKGESVKIKPADEKGFDGAKTKMEHIDETFLYEKVDVDSLQEKPKERWKPKVGDKYWIFYSDYTIKQVVCVEDVKYGAEWMFQSEAEVIAARDKVKNLLLSL